ncbi:hypothetical protein SAMN05421505_104254 [Sinosporangium album]|uniref:Uncharacterized protein n=1 Tax=Sinosporangium album TaxID=504805 RepID=A0A1G7UGP2_9ACTN|nr:hypothetical protein [Sinosporangium album]SDG46736.1 hypothetical protein SAMN05421505_104254 [Sinosporangium album]
MSYTEQDLRKVLAERSTGGDGGPARLDAIARKGRALRRRRRWAAGLTVVAVAATGASLLSPLLRDTATVEVAAPVTAQPPREEGKRLAGARYETAGELRRVTLTPLSAKTSFRVSCIAGLRVFIRQENAVQSDLCGSLTNGGPQLHMMGSLTTRPGVPITVDVVALPAKAVDGDPQDGAAEMERLLKAVRPTPSLWEVAVHDGGISTRSCSPDICDSGTLPAGGGEDNLAGLPPSNGTVPKSSSMVGKAVKVVDADGMASRTVIRCPGTDLHAYLWEKDRLVMSAPCGATPAIWDDPRPASHTLRAMVVPKALVRDGDAPEPADLQQRVKPETGPRWTVAVQPVPAGPVAPPPVGD